MSHIKVEGSNTLYRDEDNFAIINKDTNGLTRAKRVERHRARYCNSILIKLFIYIFSGA